jgi:hypothetical protein
MFPGGFDMRRLFSGFMITVMVLAIAGCAAGPNELANVPDEEGKVAGFWKGLWHGFVSPFVFLISLFLETVHIYEIHNNGGWYNFGFLFGASIILGGGGGGAARRRR